MFRRLIVVLLLLPIVPVVIYLARAAWAHQPKPAELPPVDRLKAEKPGRPFLDPSDLIVRATRDTRPRSRVDVCVSRGFVLKRVEVRGIMCRRGSCKAMVRVPGNLTLSVLQQYDFERPPSVLTPGYSC